MSVPTFPSHTHWWVCRPWKDSLPAVLSQQKQSFVQGHSCISWNLSVAWSQVARAFEVSPPKKQASLHYLPRAPNLWESAATKILVLSQVLPQCKNPVNWHSFWGPSASEAQLVCEWNWRPENQWGTQSEPVAEPQPECRSSDPSSRVIYRARIFMKDKYYCLGRIVTSSGDVDDMLDFIWYYQYCYSYSSQIVTA